MKKSNLFYFLWAGFTGLLAYWAVRLWGHFPAFMDTMEYVFPEKWFNVESFHQGRIPLWNPYIACGTPHLAAFQPAPFYPPFWIWNFTGLTDWFFILALLHEALAAVGFYLWGRALKAPPLVAALCAFGFAGSALMTFYWGFPTHLASISWIPWVFFASVRYLEKPTKSSWWLLCLFWSLHILAGYPIFTFYAVLFWIGWAYWKSAKQFKALMGLGAAFLASMILTTCQWLPFMDYLGFLHREGWGAYLYDLHWANYLTLFQPQILGVPGTSGYRGDYPDFIFNNLYLGLVPLVLFVGLFFSSKSRDSFWKRTALFWFFWLAGVHFFVWKIFPDHWLDRLEPAKAAFLFAFCAFSALAVGLSEHFQLSSKKSWVWKGAWIFGTLWILDILLVPARVVQTLPDPFQDPAVQRLAQRARQITGQGRLASLREAGRIYPAEGGTLEDSFRATAQELVPNTNVVWGLKSARGYLTIYTDGLQDLERYLQRGYPYDGRVLDAAGVNLLICPWELPSFKYRVSEQQGPSIWDHNAGAMTHAWTVETVREFPNRPAVFEAMLDPKTFLENEVYTEKGSDGKAFCLAPSLRHLPVGEQSFGEKWEDWVAGFFQRPTSIEDKSLSPCEARFEVKAQRPGFFILDESFSPGWYAWVDGEPKAIFRADGLWMAAVLPEAGTHEVVFRYEPVSFRLGLFISILCLLFAGVSGGLMATQKLKWLVKNS